MAIDLSLFKLADVLQLPITYRDGKIEGGRAGVLTTSVGLSIPFSLRAVKLFANEQCGLLAHLRGDLYIIVSHFPQTGGVSAYLLDADKLYMDGVKAPPELFISKRHCMKDVFEALKVSIVTSFRWGGGQWKTLQLPK